MVRYMKCLKRFTSLSQTQVQCLAAVLIVVRFRLYSSVKDETFNI